MRSYLRLLFAAILLTGIAAAVDWTTADGYMFGLLTGIFGVTAGLAIVGISISLALGGLIASRILDSENFGRALLSFSRLLAQVGLMTAALSYLFWVFLGKPWFP